MRSRTARLAIALLVGVAGWATGGPYGQGQSAGRRTTSPEAATAFGWRLPDWMPPPPVPPDNPMSAAKVELGRSLFFDARLAGLNYISCATCHRPEIGFSDGRPVAIGVTGERHPRNSQSLADVGYLPALTWADPGVTSLEEQSKLPLFGQHPVEMLSTGREAGIVARLGTDLRYVRLFSEAFPETEGRIDFVAIRRALAAFQRTLLSFGSPYDRYRHAGEADAIAPPRSAGRSFSSAIGSPVADAIPHPSSPTRSARLGTTTPASTTSTARGRCPPATKVSSSTRESRKTWAGFARRACATSP